MAAECFIQGIGLAVPSRSIAQSETETIFAPALSNPRTAKLFQRIARLTGIERRYLAALDYVGDGVAAPLYQSSDEQPRGPGMDARTAIFLEAAAPLVRQSLGAFSHDQLLRVRSLVTVTCTHAASPGLEQPVLACSPIPHSVHRWNLGFMGCSAGLAGLRLVHGSVADAGRSSLVLACELSSLHFQYTEELDQLTANLLFADGCAAVLLSDKRTPVRVVDCACLTLPAAADQMTWFAGNHGLQLTLSQDLPETLAANIRPTIERFLARSQTTLGQIDHWVVHPGGPLILDSIEHAMKLDSQALHWSRDVLRRFGNMSSPTVFFILRELLQARQAGRVLMAAFGPGLTIELALLEVSDL
jgi:predicted naringenin-chalcone synthase